MSLLDNLYSFLAFSEELQFLLSDQENQLANIKI